MSVQSATWIDGSPSSELPLPDRGLEFGDGLFETLLLHRGTPLFRDYHLARLGTGLETLLLPDCLEAVAADLARAAGEVGDKGWEWAALRMTVTRGAGPRGYAPPANVQPRILLTATLLERDCASMVYGARASVSSMHLARQPALAGIKHLNRLEQVLAAAEAGREGVDESLLLDESKRLVGVIAGNLFMVRGEELLTPRLLDCGVHGTRRRLITERWAPSLGLQVRECDLGLEDLAAAQEVFYSNSLFTVRPLAQVNDLSWNTHPVCEALFRCFTEALS